jgi:hypothetical protein
VGTNLRAPELNKSCRRELKSTNGAWRVAETYIRVAGEWRYLYRAVDSTGATIDFWVSAERDAAAAKRFFQRASKISGRRRPRVINVDGNPSYPKGITELRQERNLGHRCRGRTCPYLNNNLEQDRRAIKRRVNASQGFRSFEGAWRTRGPAYDPKGSSAVVTKRGCGWAGPVRQQHLRVEGGVNHHPGMKLWTNSFRTIIATHPATTSSRHFPSPQGAGVTTPSPGSRPSRVHCRSFFGRRLNPSAGSAASPSASLALDCASLTRRHRGLPATGRVSTRLFRRSTIGLVQVRRATIRCQSKDDGLRIGRRR